MKPENRGQLVRGYVVFGQRCGCLGLSQAMDDDVIDCAACFTPWHRGDDLGNIEAELSALYEAVEWFDGVDGVMSGYQYRDYK